METAEIITAMCFGISLIFSHISLFYLGKARAYKEVSKRLKELIEQTEKVI